MVQARKNSRLFFARVVLCLRLIFNWDLIYSVDDHSKALHEVQMIS